MHSSDTNIAWILGWPKREEEQTNSNILQKYGNSEVHILGLNWVMLKEFSNRYKKKSYRNCWSYSWQLVTTRGSRGSHWCGLTSRWQPSLSPGRESRTMHLGWRLNLRRQVQSTSYLGKRRWCKLKEKITIEKNKKFREPSAISYCIWWWEWISSTTNTRHVTIQRGIDLLRLWNTWLDIWHLNCLRWRCSMTGLARSWGKLLHCLRKLGYLTLTRRHSSIWCLSNRAILWRGWNWWSKVLALLCW